MSKANVVLGLLIVIPCPAAIRGAEDDRWVFAAGYILSPHAALALGYGHFGQLLNYEANSSLGLAFKYEF